VKLSAFSPTELDVLHQVAQRWAPHTTKQIEAATHGEAPWLAMRRNEIIPYHLAYYRNNFGAMELRDEDPAEGEAVLDEDAIFAR
jgi:DNA-binding transcriptional regulator YdaS (Cro superfamily)